MWVKICGITRREDALAAVQLGADAIGFVLTSSPRRADIDQLKTWIHDIHWVEKVGVFTHEDPRLIMDIGQALGLNSIQLHGEFTPGHAPLAERFEIIRAIGEQGLPEEGDPRTHGRQGVLSHTSLRGAAGNIVCRIMIDASRGTGKAGEWAPRGFPYILAGGLNPDNVRQAIARAHPAGVDVSSGVETAPGIKDVGLMERFIKEARR
ncbi:MAG TPA: phosphoribosylanthranilate isomerase [Deltaproteobacteria bacterium]|nr:phosphoribosylanthranilate isomerase [Deltaproteobacteria bacterium]